MNVSCSPHPVLLEIKGHLMNRVGDQFKKEKKLFLYRVNSASLDLAATGSCTSSWYQHIQKGIRNIH